MNTLILKTCGAGVRRLLIISTALMLILVAISAQADIKGISGTSFALTARPGNVSLGDGGSIYSWGYSESSNSLMQLPGPTLIVDEGVEITITLTNALPIAAGNTSIVFPGQDVTASGGVPGSLTNEAVPGGTVTYTFTPKAGTYQYHSGTQTDLQVEMGLYGALIVRPTMDPTAIPLGGTEPTCPSFNGVQQRLAYNNASTCYDIEYLYLLSEIDLQTHLAAQLQSSGPGPIVLPQGTYTSEYWLMNGRVGPDTMAGDSIPGQGIQPSQPYGSLSRMNPGQRVLIRVIGAGREMHPFHHHGNHARMIAIDGEPLVNSAGHLSGPLVFTIPSIPGQTADGIFEWTGKELGWDMYGSDTTLEHTCNGQAMYQHAGADPNDISQPVLTDANGAPLKNPNAAPLQSGPDVVDADTHEWCKDHGAEIPVTLPDLTNLAFGGFYSGSPYLGNLGSLPPGEGGLNPYAGFAFMWHSHTERELTNNDVFPGGMMTMMIVESAAVNLITK